ncbi:hypothetical protein PHYPSEUDO_009976 [Phytophthora pseudosyringae]|uniref:AB hydrolase-1 domain-containing protein n=1 Tax=Phytophthora pseudosyringae TaxID=221518 RepID=A0A8T1VE21_9STRA|nr:hypothetical protein PHYPSEUDO_009976 [Phytophthora pseudosyringae]
MGNSTSAAAAGSPSQDKSSVVISRVFPSSADYRLYVTPQSYVFFENSRPDAAANTTIAICLPGIGDTRRQFRLLAPLLHDRLGFRVLVGDLRGFGDSASFEDNEEDDYSTYSPEAIASDVAKLMKELKSADPSCSFVLLGNSLSAGAMVLVAATAKKADADFCIRSLVLLGPMLRDYPIEQWFRPLTYLLFRPLYGAWVWGVYYRTLYPGKGEWSSALGDLAGIPDLPVLAFFGRKDPDFFDLDGELEWFHATVPHALRFEDEEGGHYPHLENPVRVIQAIEESLA